MGKTIQGNFSNLIFDSVADLIAAKVKIGNVVDTTAYYSTQEGGSGKYEIVAGSTGTVDNGKYIDLDNGLQAELIPDQVGTYHVDQFGAKGDGTTDDGEAFENAYNALPARGGIIKMGARTYLIGRTLSFAKRTWLKGKGFTQTVGEEAPTRILKDSGLNADLIVIENDACILEAFHMRGQSGNGQRGVSVERSRFVGRNLVISHMGGNGMEIGDASAENCNYWRLDNCYFSANGENGLEIEHTTPDANVSLATNCVARDNTVDGYRIGKCNGDMFFSCSASANGSAGMRVYNGANGVVSWGGNFEANGTDDISLDAGSNHTAILYARVDGNDVADSGTDNYVITAGNAFDTCRARASFDCTGTPSVREGFNIASIASVAVGRYTVTFTNAMDNDVYAVVATAGQKGTSANAYFCSVGNITAATFDIRVLDDTGSPADVDYVCATVFGTYYGS